MKWPAVLFLIAILLTLVLGVFGEYASVMNDKMVLNAALRNSTRAARNNSINIWHLMELDAYIDEQRFIFEFSRAFADSLDLTPAIDFDNNKVVFTNSGDRFNPITVEIELYNTTYDELDDNRLGITVYHDRPVTVMTARMETPYRFKTHWLALANGVSNEDYLLISEHTFLIQIIN